MKRVSIVIVLIVWLVQFSNAATYYVDINGNDASGDGSSGKPWRTLKFAVSKVPGGQGHTIKISAGTFIEQGPIDVPTGVNIEGSGHSTVLKAASSFYYYPAEPGLSPSKFLIRFVSSSRTNGGQSIKNLAINGDGKKLHGGIVFQKRDNVLAAGLKLEYINFNGLWLSESKNARITDSEFLNSAYAHYNACYGALMIGNVENVEIDHVKIDEGWGYGLKALTLGIKPPTTLTNVKIHDCHVTVNGYGVWQDGHAANIAVELWSTYLNNVEIYNNYIDNTLSLVSNYSAPPVAKTVHVHHNFFDIAARSKGEGYSIELTLDDVEVDHNFFNTGTNGMAEWSTSTSRRNWNIHHNIFYGLKGQWPSHAVISRAPVTNLKFNNNVFESTGGQTAHVLGFYTPTAKANNVEVKNNLFINSNTAYNYGTNQLIRLQDGGTVQNLQVTNNLFHKLDVGNIPGTYASNITGVDPQINVSGNRPDPYYRPKAGSPLIDKGINVGFPYSGSAPDIGAYEYGSTPTPPANTPPSVGLSSPANNASFPAGSNITLTANAADANGSITRVEFFNGTTKLGEDTAGPYSFAWSNVQAGTYTITAKATDNQGATTTSTPVTITVVAAANVAPVVNITSPTNNANFTSGASISINANATDSDGSVSKVEFFSGTTKLGEDTSSPYSYTWPAVAAGTYSITARATDNQGAIANSAAVTLVVNVGNTLPTISLTSPANNSTYTAPASFSIAANASDADGTISKVEFFHGTTKLGEDTSSPYSYNWSNAAAGTYAITAKATDNSGGVTTSAVRTVTIQANALPTVALTSPSNNANFTAGSNITLAATAADNDGTISKVEFFRGTVKLGEDLTSPYSFVWNGVTAGSHSLTARATDNNSGIKTSAAITVNVGNPNSLPTVNLTSPSNNATFASGTTITLSASATDQDGTISKVEFYNGNTKLGEDTSAPYSLAWANVPTGSYTLRAVAIDNNGGSGTSSNVTITVGPAANSLPTIALTSPNNNAAFSAGSAITITANATDSDGSITKVEFFNGATKLGEDLVSPYGYVWNNVSTGSYTLTAKATDNKNGTSTSAAVRINVAENNAMPSITITSPANNSNFTAGSSISIAATASDNDGAIAKVEFFNGAQKLGEDTSSPYNYNWTNSPVGNHTIIAKATDNDGATATAQVNILVDAPNIPPVADAGEDANVAFPENTITLKGTGEDGDGTIVDFTWTQVDGPNDASIVDGSVPGEAIISGLVEGIYKFVLTVTDNSNLTGSDEVVVKVAPQSLSSIQLPLVFTPNNDGIDDTWNWSDTEAFENCKLIIYNRFGQKIYETVSYDNSWDGRVNGSPLQEDAYYYVITCENEDKQGAVRIVR
jgi:gliding motility-associated-like protein